MADTSLRSRLQRLFSTNVIVRNVGGRKLKVADTSRTQAATRSNLVDRYQNIYRCWFKWLFRFVINKINEIEFV